MKTSWAIKKVGEQLIKLLTEKNLDYGDSATRGETIFASKINMDSMTPKQFGLCCRLDDKLNRIKNRGITKNTIDTLWDIGGYIILLLITFNYDKNYNTSVKEELDKIQDE
jgi:hypothetical protein|tara:strand:- start:1581 stop:1913 length:333 start_codon:yes stop_codon:yes gene_type:complete